MWGRLLTCGRLAIGPPRAVCNLRGKSCPSRLARQNIVSDYRKESTMDIRKLLTAPPSNSQLSRRGMLRAAGCGFGYLGLQSLMADIAQAQQAAAIDPLI